MFRLPQVCRIADGGGSGGGGTPAPSAPDGGGTPASPSPSSTPSAAPSGTPSPTPTSSEPSVSPSPAPTPSGGADPGPVTPAPPVTPPTPHDNSLGDGLFEFPESGDGDLDEGDNPPPTPAPAKTPAPAAAAPAEPAKTPPTGAEPAAQTPPVAEPAPQPSPEPQGPQGTSPQSFPTEPAEIAQGLMQAEQAMLDHLSTQEFALSPQDLEALEADAPAHIPKLLARVYFKSQVNLMQQMSRLVPQMIQKQLRVSESNRKNEDRFYSRWPDLDRGKHEPLVKKYATVYRQANPQATLDQMIEELGPIIMMAGKVTPRAAAPVNGNGAARAPQPTPFVPALGGPSAPPVAAEENPWAGMAQPPQDED
jgi:hypothetical protein